MLLLFVCIALVALFTYPGAAVAFRRQRLIRRMKKSARRFGGNLRVLRSFAIFSRNRSKHYDLLVEQGNTVYAVKLWSARRAGRRLRVSENGLVSEERTVSAPLSPRGKLRERVLATPFFQVARTGLRQGVPKDKNLIRVLLLYPSYQCVFRFQQGTWREIQSGERIFDKILSSPLFFEKMLCHTQPQ